MSQDPQEPPQRPDEEIVCHCMCVDLATIRRAIAAGARSVEELQDATYASTGCGTCRFDLMELLGESER